MHRRQTKHEFHLTRRCKEADRNREKRGERKGRRDGEKESKNGRKEIPKCESKTVKMHLNDTWTFSAANSQKDFLSISRNSS